MDTSKLDLYRRGSFVGDPATLHYFLMEELRKLERQAETYYDAFTAVSAELEALKDRVSALEAP